MPMPTQRKSRYDPNEYARKKKAAMERAARLRSERSIDQLDEECTFIPKLVCTPIPMVFSCCPPY